MDLRELEKRVGAPYFMVTATLPEERRRHFFTPAASEVYQLSFAAAQANLSTLHLPVLRWGNETDCQLPPTLARPSRTAAEEDMFRVRCFGSVVSERIKVFLGFFLELGFGREGACQGS